MIKKLLCFIFLLNSILLFPVKDSVINENLNYVLSISNVNNEISKIPDYFNMFLTQNKSQYEDGFVVLNKVILDEFNNQKIETIIFNYFKANYNDSKIKNIIKFYNSALFKKINGIENQSGTPEFYNKFASYDLKSADSDRILFINKFLDDIRINEFQETIIGAVYDGFVQTINATLTDDKKINNETIELYKKNLIQSINDSDNRNLLLKKYYLAFENISEKDLTAYKKFYSSSDYIWFSNFVKNAVTDSFMKCTQNASLKIVDLLLPDNKIDTFGNEPKK